MAYLLPIHGPTSVRHAIKLKFLSPNEDCLIVAKADRLEIYTQTPDGWILSNSSSLFGQVLMLEKLHPAQSPTDQLFVGTDRYMYFVLSWDTDKQRLKTVKSYIDNADKTARDSFNQDRCLIDPTNQFMALQLYDGIVTIIPIGKSRKKKEYLDDGALGDPIPARISDLMIRSTAFLYSRNEQKERPKVAFLYEDIRQKVCLSIRLLEFSAGTSGEAGTADLEDILYARDDIDLSASHLIPVPAPAYGLLILAETSIKYYDYVKKKEITKILEQAAIFVAWTQIDAQKWILSDEYGRLYSLVLKMDAKGVTGWELDLIGNTSRASVLVYLGNGYVFVGSHQGDSQFVLMKEGGIETAQIMPNIAPILDFAIMEMGNRAVSEQINDYSSGQARIVTGSGAFQDGSLRSIRNGIRKQEHGLIPEMGYITHIFSLRSTIAKDCVDVLVVSFVDITRVFQFDTDGEVEEKAQFFDFSLLESTLLARNISDGRVLQVTRTRVRIADLEDAKVVAEWEPPSEEPIVGASANDQYLAVSVRGLQVVILDLHNKLRVTAKKTFDEDGQIACLHIPTFSSKICIIGFWLRANVTIFKLDSLEPILRTTVSDDPVPVARSILLTHILPAQPPTLLVSMANGEVITFSFDLDNYQLSAKKTVVLGTQHASFEVLRGDDGLSKVFATCEYPSLVYASGGRIVYSAIPGDEISCVCAFDTEAYPGAVAIATAEDLRIATVDTQRTTHVQTLAVEKTVRRIAYSASLGLFGLGTIQRSLRDGREVMQSHFKLADDISFNEIDSYALEEDEIVECAIVGDLKMSNDWVHRFVVGTAVLEYQEDRAAGRILVFTVTAERVLQLVAKVGTNGACRALGIVCGDIVAALIKTVAIYNLSSDTLRKAQIYRTSTAPVDISVSGTQIAVADLMKSVSVLSYEGSPDKRLTEIARHYQTSWSTAVAHISDNSYLESDAEGNIMLLERNESGVTEDDRRRLEIISSFRLGQMVNRIRTFDSPVSENSVVIPAAFLGTVEGSIYLFAIISPKYISILMQLQNALTALVTSPGDVPFYTFRAFKNQVREDLEPYRSVDGELIEKFLDLDEDVQDNIVTWLTGEQHVEVGTGTGKNIDAAGLRTLVEGLKRFR